LNLHWSQLDGPGQTTFGNATVAETSASFSLPGIYVLQLSANDTLNEASDTVEVRVDAICTIDNTRGLTAWWPGNGNATNVIGRETGRLLNGAGFRTGKASMGFSFDGVDDSVRVPASAAHDVAKSGDGSLTIEFWSNTTDRDQQPVLLGWNNGSNWGTYIYERQGYWESDLRAALIDTNGVRHEIAAYESYFQSDTRGVWHHYAVTYDKPSGIAKLYVNGILQAQSNLGSFTPQTSYDLYFGYVQGQSTPYTGMLDEISLYNRALDGQEIYDIFAADKNGKCPVDQNQAPVVSAGPSQSTANNNGTVTVTGTVSDDGLPMGSTLSVQWT
jgi:hypothetical protein